LSLFFLELAYLLWVVLVVVCTEEAKVRVIWPPLTPRSNLLFELTNDVQEAKVGKYDKFKRPTWIPPQLH